MLWKCSILSATNSKSGILARSQKLFVHKILLKVDKSRLFYQLTARKKYVRKRIQLVKEDNKFFVLSHI